LALSSTDGQELSDSNYAGVVTIFDWSVESCKLDPMKKPTIYGAAYYHLKGEGM